MMLPWLALGCVLGMHVVRVRRLNQHWEKRCIYEARRAALSAIEAEHRKRFTKECAG